MCAPRVFAARGCAVVGVSEGWSGCMEAGAKVKVWVGNNRSGNAPEGDSLEADNCNAVRFRVHLLH